MKAIYAGWIHPVSSPVIRDGMVLVGDSGKIEYVGPKGEAPEGALILHHEDEHVTPGLIDAQTYIALSFEPRGMREHSDTSENADPFTPQVSVRDGFYPHDYAIGIARMAGFTTCYVSPGFDNVIGGLGAAFKMKKENDPEKMFLPGSEGMTLSLGEIPVKAGKQKGRAPMTRMGLYAELREFLRKSSEYAAKESPDYDEKLEAMKKVMKGETPLHVHACRAGDMLNAMELLDSFSLRYLFVNATESCQIADELAARQIPCVVGNVFAYPFRSELWEARSDTPVLLQKAGLKDIAFTCDETDEVEFLRAYTGRYAALGMEKESVLECLTLSPARILGIADRVGSLEAGKDADLAFFNGDPVSNLTCCTGSMIDGVFYGERRG